MDGRQGAAQAVLVARGQNEVDVIGHQTPRPDLDPGRATGVRQQIAIKGVVVLAEEDARASVAALRHMMRQARNDDAGKASHGSG